ncbi:MAG: hypothetical protein QOH49_3088 [Acidobacteriota bacterium]|jgi:hypothetical protein|nr:hypothetical protein [Acidobacteriota bacterium]
MTVVKEVIDAMKLLADGIKSMETFISACKDGRKFLKSQHPDVGQDLSVMCSEIRKTLLAMADASAVVTNFRFTVAGSALDAEPRKFNDAFIAHKPKEIMLRQQIETSRGRCRKIETHAMEMEKKATSHGFSSLFSLLGVKSKKQEKVLSTTLWKIYNEDMMFHTVVQQMTVAVVATFKAVQDKLGPAGTMNPANVSKAAKTLSEHAKKFEEIESKCNHLAGELEAIIDEINPQGSK